MGADPRPTLVPEHWRFVERLAELIGCEPEQALELLMARDGAVLRSRKPSAIRDGRFTRLFLGFCHPTRAQVWQPGWRSLEGRPLPVLSLPGLTELDCSGTGISILQLEGLGQLERLDCAGNNLAALDLRRLPSLQTVDCSDNPKLVLLTTEAHSRITSIDASSCHLHRLRVETPQLTTLRVQGNALAQLDLGACAALTSLDCSNNELDQLDLSRTGSLRRINCSDNELAALDLSACGGLRELDCSHNGIKLLDLRHTPRLARLVCGNNPLAWLDLADVPGLQNLSCTRARLSRLELVCVPRLRRLDCAGNRITELDPASCPGLEVLDCSNNRIEHLCLIDNPALLDLRCHDNRLRELELGDLPLLRELDCADNRLEDIEMAFVPEGVFLRGHGNPALDDDEHEDSMPVLPRVDLAAMFDLRPAPPPPRARPAAPSARLHEFARQQVDTSSLRNVIESEECDLGTALMVYWRSEPQRLLASRPRERLTAVEAERFELLELIERRVMSGNYRSFSIAYDPRDDEGVDLTRSAGGIDCIPELIRGLVVVDDVYTLVG